MGVIYFNEKRSAEICRLNRGNPLNWDCTYISFKKCILVCVSHFLINSLKFNLKEEKKLKRQIQQAVNHICLWRQTVKAILSLQQCLMSKINAAIKAIKCSCNNILDFKNATIVKSKSKNTVFWWNLRPGGTFLKAPGTYISYAEKAPGHFTLCIK